MDGITELACFLHKNRDLSIENSLRLIECTLEPLLAFSGLVIILPEKEFNSLCPMPQGGLADVAKHIHSTFYHSERPRRPTGKKA